jgi:hypothetical protein
MDACKQYHEQAMAAGTRGQGSIDDGDSMDSADVPLCNEYAAIGGCSAGEDRCCKHGDQCKVGTGCGLVGLLRWPGGKGCGASWWGVQLPLMREKGGRVRLYVGGRQKLVARHNAEHSARASAANRTYGAGSR